MEENTKIVSTEDVETQQTENSVPDKPCKARCEECKTTTITFMKKSYNIYSYLIAILIFHIYGFLYGIPLIIIIIPLCQNITHECPNCGSTLLVDKFCNIKLQEKNKFIWLQYGNCILIFRLVYVLIFLAIILILGAVNYTAYLFFEDNSENQNHFYAHNHSHLENLVKSPSNLSWEELINDCGGKVMVENSARANEIFNRKFYKKTIEWKGYFLSAFIQGFNPLDFNPEHILNLNIRMIPSESLKNPDLFLSLDSHRYNKYMNEIRKLKTQDPILFRASFEALGNEWRPHHLHLIHIQKIDDFIDADKKLLLFKGVEFDITGHLKNEKKINEILKESEKAKNLNVTMTDDKGKIDAENQIKNQENQNLNKEKSELNQEEVNKIDQINDTSKQ